MDLAAELRLVRMRALRAVLVRLDAGAGFADGRSAGDTFLREPADRELLGHDPLRPAGGRGRALARVDAALDAAPADGPAARLAARFALDPIASHALVTAAAVALDPDTADMCRALSNGRAVGVRVDLIAELWRVPATRVVAAVDRLCDAGLVTARGDGPLLGRGLELAPRLATWLSGADALPASLAAIARLDREPATDAWLPPETQARVAELAGHDTVVVNGPQGAGKRNLAQQMAAAGGRPTLVADLATVLASPSPAELCRALLIEAHLHGALLYLAAAELLDDEASWNSRAVVHLITGHRGPLVLATRDPALAPRIDRPLMTVKLERPSLAGRTAAWRASLAHAGLALGEGAAEELAARYVVGPGTVAEVVREAARQPAADRAAIDAAIGRQLSVRLGSFGALIHRRARMEDMIVPDEVRDSLLDMLAMVRERARILERWGYADHLGLSRGVSSLFLGSPGTGKTMAASAIAGELGLPLFRIDLAAVVSKWIGETEKHLARIFDEAQSAQALLLFDEADSLFGKRTEVQSSNDRYANVEINYLLQRMETFDGITILTSNLESGIDKAFMRRLNFRIRFPDPDAGERAELWRTLLPPEAELEGEPDFAALGDEFDMTGGHIRNAIVRAAVLAARDDRAIRPDDLVEGARHEYFELGKLVPGRTNRL